MSDYLPIACGLHESYQYAVIKRAQLDLVWRTESGEIRQARVLPLDVFTRQGGEYLSAQAEDGVLYEIRLDRIERSLWASDGRPLSLQV